MSTGGLMFTGRVRLIIRTGLGWVFFILFFPPHSASQTLSPHFPPSLYPLLAREAKGDTCLVCHVRPQKTASLVIPETKGELREFRERGYAGPYLLPSTRLCLGCHGSGNPQEPDRLRQGNLRGYSPAANHPVEIRYDEVVVKFPSKYNPRDTIPDMLFEKHGGRKDFLSCLTCHDPHAPASRKHHLRARDEEMGSFCLQCHKL